MYAWPDGGENQIASLPPAHPTHRLQHLAKITHTLHICLIKENSELEFSWSSDYQPSAYQRSSILDLLKLSASDQNWTDCSTNTAGACTQFSLADEPTRCQNYLQEYNPLGLKKISPFSLRYESSTLILFKELSSPIFTLWVCQSVCQASVTPVQISTFCNI